MAHPWQAAESLFGLVCVKSLETSSQISQPKLEQFAAMEPHLLMLGHSMPSKCDHAMTHVV
jgi:hypothetical protein